MPSINIDYDDIFKSIADYVVATAHVSREEIVKPPIGNDPLPFNAVVITIINTENRDTNYTVYDRENAEAHVSRSVQARVQIDFYGPLSGRRSQIIETLWRSEYSVENLAELAPLFVHDRFRDIYVNDSERYEDRWILDLALQYNPVVIHNQEFVTDIDLTLIQVRSVPDYIENYWRIMNFFVPTKMRINFEIQNVFCV